MSLDNFKQVYENTYQVILSKILVGKKLANYRLQAGLKYGESVTRAIADISGVLVRDITILTDRTVDTISDSEELLTINYNKGTTFAISKKEMIQAGPLNPATFVGAEVAKKTATQVDATILGEVVNAYADFDTGNLTTVAATAVPITMSSTTVPQMAARMGAKLGTNNISLSDLAFVTDHYSASDIQQYLMGKDWDVSQSTLMNGYVGGNFGSAKVYVSENLAAGVHVQMATQPTADDTVVINGLTFTFVASPSAEGDIDLGADVDATRANLEAALNQGSGAGSDYIAFTGADLATLVSMNVTAVNNDTTDVLEVTCVGTGRILASETFTDGTDTVVAYIHSYFGKHGAIDVVMQEEVDMEVRLPSKQRSQIIMSDALWGVKTFSDGSQKFLDVHIATA